MTIDAWWERGACRTAGLPVDVWVPNAVSHGKTRGDRAQTLIDACKAICAGCQVRGICEAEAMATPDERGIRGGLTYEERMAAGQTRRIRPLPPHGTVARYSSQRARCRCEECRAANRRAIRARAERAAVSTEEYPAP